jgi:hypothetical protein
MIALVATALCAPTTSAKDGGWGYEKYQVQITIAIDAPGGLAERLADELPRHLRRRVEASLVPAWNCEVRVAAGAERARMFTTVAAPEPSLPTLPEDKWKLILATVRWTPEGVVLTAREFDRYVERWSLPILRESRQEASLPEQLFALAWRTFSPLAQLQADPKDQKQVVLKPRGGSLPHAAGAAPWAKPGDVFLPVLRRTTRGGQLEKNGIQVVAWTYIEAADVKHNAIVGRVQSAMRRPFPPPRRGRLDQVAIAIHADPEPFTLQLRSRTAATKPLIGYEVFSELPGEKALARIGPSDTAGRLRIQPGKTPVQFLVVKHGGQLFARVPVVAGAQRRLDMPLPDDDARLVAEARLSAVREDLIDIVARRNILISRARQKIEKQDLAAAEQIIRALDELPGRPQFDVKLRTAEQSLRSNDPQMQRRITSLFDTTRTLVNQYLDLRPINELRDELRQAERKSEAKTSARESTSKG